MLAVWPIANFTTEKYYSVIYCITSFENIQRRYHARHFNACRKHRSLKIKVNSLKPHFRRSNICLKSILPRFSFTKVSLMLIVLAK